MAKILITGGAGFIASALAKRLSLNQNDSIVIVDNLLTGSMRKVPVSPFKNINFIKCDVNNFKEISQVFAAFKFEYVFHYAAMVGVQRTLSHPVSVLEDIEGLKNIMNLSKNSSVRRVIYSSSSEVYGEPVQIPQNEHTTPLNSRLPYAIVKNIGEAFLRAYKDEYGLEYTIFRFFNTYGPLQSEDFVVSKFIKAALAQEDILIYGDGLQTRTFCYIDDNVDCCERIFRDSLHVNDVINIGSDSEITVLELAKIIVEITGSTSRIVHAPALSDGDMSRRQPDIAKMKAVLNRPLITLEAGLQQLLKERKIS